MSTTLSYLSALYGTASDNSGPGGLLAALYGQSGQSVNPFGGNPVTALKSAESRQTQAVKATAAQPEVNRAVNAFTAGVNNAKTVKDLLANPAVMKVLLTANGLGNQVAYTALAQKALQSDVTDPKSLVNRLTDTRWKPVAQTYDFANNALTFRKQASTISSIDQILGDPLLRKVVTTALNIPLQIAFQPLLAQEKAVSAQLDITKFKDPKYVESFVQRYLLAAQASANTNTTPDLYSLAVQSRGLVV
jgi:Protein of unknown function (DUF1217)